MFSSKPTLFKQTNIKHLQILTYTNTDPHIYPALLVGGMIMSGTIESELTSVPPGCKSNVQLERNSGRPYYEETKY